MRTAAIATALLALFYVSVVWAAAGAVTFLIEYRIPFMIVGVGINAVGIAVAAHRLHHTGVPKPHHKSDALAHS